MIYGWILFALIYGAIDCDVSPERAEIYIDGKYVGIADSFDGWPRYLYIEKGLYEIVFKLEGYEDLVKVVEVIPNKIVRINENMVRIPPSQYEEKKEEKEGERKRKFGKISLKVEPEEASCYLDGNFWISGKELTRLHYPLQILEGKHIINVVYPGYEEYKKEIEIKEGEYLEIIIVLNKK